MPAPKNGESGAAPAKGSVPSPWDAGAVPGLPPGRPGRDRLAARILMAECLLAANGPLTASRVLAPLTDALPDLTPSCDGPGTWPWPSELAGRALCVAGKAASRLGPGPRAAALLRLALDTLGPEPDAPATCRTPWPSAGGARKARGRRIPP
ncbi:MAG: hypothetical protein LBT40_04725 [Deltaproteobacteria bacterium]|nr:hypothetical protein [Deltaproteobacteria bacterium]